MTLLAPDPAVPRRNSLLRPLTMAGVLSQRLHGGVPVERCERLYVKYRVGESLRAVYRYTAAKEANGYRLDLTPKSSALKRFVKTLMVYVDDQYRVTRTVAELGDVFTQLWGATPTHYGR